MSVGENTSVFSDGRGFAKEVAGAGVAESRRNTNYNTLRAMALNLLDALFQSLNSIKSGNEVC